MRSRFFIFSFLLFFSTVLWSQGGGMWLPQVLSGAIEGDMQSLGMKMSAEEVYSLNQGSLKDAIVHFGGFCTGEVISSQGLVLTNHHCGYGRIQSHSSVERNLLKDGFWAERFEDELPNPGLFVTFIKSVEDVTEQILSGVEAGMSEEARNTIIEANSTALKDSREKNSAFEDYFVRAFYHGNQYYLFHTLTYRDVRLVGTPPSSIGKFGADTDNWEWPRHTGDFALFRIYANKNNEPAEYDPDNVPFQAPYHLPISLDGAAEGDFTMVFGFPGRTDQYLPSTAVRVILEQLNPVKIEVRRRVLAIMDREMRADAAVQIQYASKYASVANAYKKWIGESQGLTRVNALEEKLNYEASFNKRAGGNKMWSERYGTVLAELNALHDSIAPYAYARDLFSEVIRNSEIMRIAASVNMLIRIAENNGEEAFKQRWAQMRPGLENQFMDFHLPTEQMVYAELLNSFYEMADEHLHPAYLKSWKEKHQHDFETLTGALFQASVLTDFKELSSTIESNNFDNAILLLKSDPIFNVYFALINVSNQHVNPGLRALQTAIDARQRLYMEGQKEIMTERRFFPDANSTLRVTYGQVKGYKPRDAVRYSPISYLDGVIEKYVPGDYEFDLPEKLISLHKNKDYGIYADESGSVPVCFLGTNQTTGGNSGSPAIDAYGNLIGLNFDRVWEGTMSDIYYDAEICRNIMVDARYILFVIDKFAESKHIMSELTLVYPKTKRKVPVFNRK